MVPAMRLPLQLRFGDIDSYGHVNNVTFLSLLETARVRLHNQTSAKGTIADAGGPASGGELADDGPEASLRVLAGSGNFTLVGRQEIEYLAPLHYRDEPVYVHVWVTGVGRSSFELGYSVTEEDESTVYAVAATTMVLVSRESGRPVALPEAYRSSLEQHLGPEVPFRRRTHQAAGA
ncbi:thioesterase [Arthrobacter crystallopoietes BAB-32]|uniref:Thioesterase n=1 Tax=Arthrobacter crystallopoietes BAB-32 TaxID=1246476 RepID=N1V589_9MICC|nr:thioesterase family protein [Arthrobacter crystallopoietes]EMY35247.1 thioesterase [Arthrobacter crystallopoietes BAB-32]